MPEPLCSDLLHQIQPYVPHYPRANVSLKPKELSSTTVYYVYWEFASRIEGGSGSRNKDI